MTRMYAAALAASLFLAACGARPSLSDATLSPAVISPDADGHDDLARLAYTINAPATVSIYLTDATGARHDIRRAVQRPASPKPYELLFNGIDADGKLVPNGDYTWHVDAGDQLASGPLRIEHASAARPRINEFTLDSAVFTPNRDAISDHIYINIGLATPAKLVLYVTGPNGYRQDIPREELARANATDALLDAGRYYFDYDGGIDKGADPPPDGDYVLVAEAADLIGQRDVVTRSLTIKDSGRPVAEIVTQQNGQGVTWSGVGTLPEVTLKLGDRLYFTTTVINYGTSPIRTAGPFDPDDCYTLDINRYTKGFAEEPGVWRIGVDFETNTGEDHPFRWGVGTLNDLNVVRHNGSPLYYLAPGKQVVVRGCVQLTRIPVRNPFRMWVSLIQEQVEITFVNNRVSPILVTLVKP